MRAFASLSVVVLLGVAACTAPEPFKVVEVDLSNKIDAGNRVYSPGTVFSADSTVYASIATEGAGEAKLGATWFDADGTTVLAEQSQDVEQDAPAHYEFHHKPEGGWTQGKRYSVILSVDGGQKRNREFEIR
jgi:hypothetical protein